MGSASGDDKEVRILTWVVRWEEGKLRYEADHRHA